MLKNGEQFSFPEFPKNPEIKDSHVNCCEVQVGHTVQFIGKNWNGPKLGSIGTICAKRVSTATVQLINGVKWTIPYSMLAAYDSSNAMELSLV